MEQGYILYDVFKKSLLQAPTGHFRFFTDMEQAVISGQEYVAQDAHLNTLLQKYPHLQVL